MAGGSRSATINLTGTTSADLVGGFTDSRSDFGTVFCGATADARTYRLTNFNGSGITVSHPTFLSSHGETVGTYFTITAVSKTTFSNAGTPTVNTVAPTFTDTDLPGVAGGQYASYIDFTVSADAIPPEVVGAAQLAPTSEMFWDAIRIPTTGGNINNDYSYNLKMFAQGVLVGSPSLSGGDSPTWTYPSITWPATSASAYQGWFDNQGNANGLLRLSPNDAQFSLTPSPTVVAPTNGGNRARLDSTFTPTCDATTKNYSSSATVTVVADLGVASHQSVTGLVGICGLANSALVAVVDGSQCTTRTSGSTPVTADGRTVTGCAAWRNNNVTLSAAVAVDTSSVLRCGDADHCCNGSAVCVSQASSGGNMCP